MPVAVRSLFFFVLALGIEPTRHAALGSVEAHPREKASSFSEKDLECLALNVYHEARSEPEEGQLAVAAVTLNRVESESFPDSVCGVVKQGGERLHRCQFSWWCDGKQDTPTNREAWADALRIGRLSLQGQVPDPTKGALYYHASYVKPKWSRKFERTARIGAHLFYRPKDAQPMRLASLD